MATRLPVLVSGGNGRDPAFGEGLVGDGAFDRLDGDRLVDDVERAGGLARRWADAPGHFREIVGRVEVLRRVQPVGMIDEVVPVGDLVVDRATGVTIGDAAIHAARGLARDLGLARGDDELAVMADAIGGRLVAPVLAFDLEKARNLAHQTHALWPKAKQISAQRIVTVPPLPSSAGRCARGLLVAWHDAEGIVTPCRKIICRCRCASRSRSRPSRLCRQAAPWPSPPERGDTRPASP